MHTKGIFGLIVTVLLCVPSFAGAITLLTNLMMERPVEEWGTAASLLVASVIFVGWPLVAIAAVSVAVIGLRHRIPQFVSFMEYSIVILATLATLAVTARFRM